MHQQGGIPHFPLLQDVAVERPGPQKPRKSGGSLPTQYRPSCSCHSRSVPRLAEGRVNSPPLATKSVPLAHVHTLQQEGTNRWPCQPMRFTHRALSSGAASDKNICRRFFPLYSGRQPQSPCSGVAPGRYRHCPPAESYGHSPLMWVCHRSPLLRVAAPPHSSPCESRVRASTRRGLHTHTVLTASVLLLLKEVNSVRALQKTGTPSHGFLMSAFWKRIFSLGPFVGNYDRPEARLKLSFGLRLQTGQLAERHPKARFPLLSGRFRRRQQALQQKTRLRSTLDSCHLGQSWRHRRILLPMLYTRRGLLFWKASRWGRVLAWAPPWA